jgi:hypothetical protein
VRLIVLSPAAHNTTSLKCVAGMSEKIVTQVACS